MVSESAMVWYSYLSDADKSMLVILQFARVNELSRVGTFSLHLENTGANLPIRATVEANFRVTRRSSDA